jgi:protein-S-isoprenylcysteine O-methyltransferase Ste14
MAGRNQSPQEKAMDTARYAVAVLILVSTPIALGLWYVIHPFARYWRWIGPGWTYAILAVPALLADWALWSARDALLGADLGTRAVLLVLIVPSVIAGAAIARVRRRQLNQRILTGIPELSSRDKGRLVTEGIYARVRNPRYAEFLVFVLAYVAFANYLGTWVLYALTFPAVHAVVLLEERELRDRFGTEYEEYCRRVPRYIPSLRVRSRT